MDDPAVALDAPFYEWTRVAANWLDRTITFEVKPEFGSTAGSMWATVATAFAAGLSAGVNQTPLLYVPPHQEIEFKAEFMDLRVYREEELLAPIHPGRRVAEASFRNYDMTFIDEAYSGMYVYDPNDFMTGNRFTFEVYDAREPERVHKAVNVVARSKLIRQLRADFAPDPFAIRGVVTQTAA